MHNLLGGRKVTMAMVILAAGVVIDLVTERGLSEPLMYLMLGIIGSFTAGNVMSKKYTPAKDSSPELDTLKDDLNLSLESLDAQQQVLATEVQQNQKRIMALLTQMGGAGSNE